MCRSVSVEIISEIRGQVSANFGEEEDFDESRVP